MMQPIRMRTAIEMRLFTSGKASSSSPVLVLKVPTHARKNRMKQGARSIQPNFLEISVQNSMDRFGSTGNKSFEKTGP